MEELLIGEKKYYSSRKAGGILGYTNDYVGKLCREGKLDGTLVGRTWYVSERALAPFIEIQKVEKVKREFQQSNKMARAYKDQNRKRFDAFEPPLKAWAALTLVFLPAFMFVLFTADRAVSSRLVKNAVVAFDSMEELSLNFISKNDENSIVPNKSRSSLAAASGSNENKNFSDVVFEEASTLFEAIGGGINEVYGSYKRLAGNTFDFVINAPADLAFELSDFYISSLKDFNATTDLVFQSAKEFYKPLLSDSLAAVGSVPLGLWDIGDKASALAETTGELIAQSIIGPKSYEGSLDVTMGKGNEVSGQILFASASTAIKSTDSEDLNLWGRMIDTISDSLVPLFQSDDIILPVDDLTVAPAVVSQTLPATTITYSASPVSLNNVLNQTVYSGVTMPRLQTAIDTLRLEMLALNLDTRNYVDRMRRLQSESDRDDDDEDGNNNVDLSNIANSTITDSTFEGSASLSTLTLSGSFIDGLNSAGTDGYVLQTTGSGVEWVATSSLGFGSGGSSQWTTAGSNIYYTTGNVGIGTTSSVANRLTVLGAIVGGTSGISGLTANSLSLDFCSGCGNANRLLAVGADNSTEAKFQIATADLDATTYNTLTFTGGKLGVSSTTPSSALTVADGTDWITFSGTGFGSKFVSSGDVLFRAGGNGGVGSFADTYFDGNTILFRSAPGTTEYAKFTSTGNFGIGTTSPYAKLSVAGQVVGEYFTSTSTGKTFIAQNNGASYLVPQLSLESYNTGVSLTGNDEVYLVGNNIGVFSVKGAATPLAKMKSNTIFGWTNNTVNGSLDTGLSRYAANTIAIGNGTSNDYSGTLIVGNIGVGTTSPYAKLSVAGNVVAQNFTATSTATSTLPTLSVTGRFYDSAGTAGANGYVLQTTGSGVTWVATTSLGISGSGSGTVNTGTTGQVPYYAGAGTAVTATSTLFISTASKVGVGTTTVNSALSLSSGGINPWALHSGGLNLSNSAGSSIAGFLNNVSADYSLFNVLRPGGTVDTGDFQFYVQGPSYSSAGIFTPSTVVAAARSDFTGGIKLGATGGPTSLFAGGTNLTNIGLTLTTSGNVGIGTTTPAAKFTIYEGNDSATLTNFTQSLTSAGINVVSDFVAGNYVPGIFWSTIDNNSTKPKAGIFAQHTNLGTSLILGTANSYTTGVTNTALVINPSGNIGVGTTSPYGKLSVWGTGTGTGQLFSLVDSASTTVFQALDNGNIGIGTTLPEKSLEIRGGANSTESILLRLRNPNTGTGTGGAIDFMNTTGTGNDSFAGARIATVRNGDSTNDLILYVNPNTVPTERFRLRGASGNVGIGTSTPFGRLHLVASTTPNLIFSDVRAGTDLKHWYASSTAGSLAFGKINDALTTITEYARFTTTGNFGIGTTTPTTKLEVFDSAFNPVTLRTSGAVGPVLTFAVGGSTSGFVGMDGGGLTSGASQNDLTIRGNASGMLRFNISSNTHMVLSNTGNLGIGTTTTNNKLDIYSTTKSAIGFSGAAGDNYKWTMGMDVSNGGRFSIASSTALGTIDRLVILGDGNVGIGTTSPYAKLAVVGNVVATNFIATSSTLGFQAANLLGGATNLTVDANGNIIRDPSDRNLKENIEDLDGALDKILALRGVSYEWKDKVRFGSQTEIGVIAQEVELVVPEVVSSGGAYKSVNIKNLVALLIEAVKELAKKLEGVVAWFQGNSFRVQGDVCVDDVCVSKEQFKALLINAGHDDAESSDEDPEPEVDSPEGDVEEDGTEELEPETQGEVEMDEDTETDSEATDTDDEGSNEVAPTENEPSSDGSGNQSSESAPSGE